MSNNRKKILQEIQSLLFNKNRIVIKILDISASLSGERNIHEKSDIDLILIISDDFSHQDISYLKKSVAQILTKYAKLFRHPPYIITKKLFSEMKQFGIHQNYFDREITQIDKTSKKLTLLEWSLDQLLIATWSKYKNSKEECNRITKKLKKNIATASELYKNHHFQHNDSYSDHIESVKKITKIVSEDCFAENIEEISTKKLFLCSHRDYNLLLFSDSQYLINLSKIIQKMTGVCIATFPKSSYISFLIFQNLLRKKLLPNNGILEKRYNFYIKYKIFLKNYSLEQFSLELPAMYLYFSTKRIFSY